MDLRIVSYQCHSSTLLGHILEQIRNFIPEVPKLRLRKWSFLSILKVFFEPEKVQSKDNYRSGCNHPYLSQSYRKIPFLNYPFEGQEIHVIHVWRFRWWTIDLKNILGTSNWIKGPGTKKTCFKHPPTVEGISCPNMPNISMGRMLFIASNVKGNFWKVFVHRIHGTKIPTFYKSSGFVHPICFMGLVYLSIHAWRVHLSGQME